MKNYTDIEQSKVLAEMLPLKTADMRFCFSRTLGGRIVGHYPMIGREPSLGTVPCWSLAALLDMLPKSEDKAFDLSYGHYGNDTYIPKWYISYIDNSKNIPFIKMIDGDNLIDIVVQLLMYLKANEQI